MKNMHLECAPGWRFCNVVAGDKRPYPKNWQNMPVTIDQIDSTNVGLLLGPQSQGVMALDFDGASAWQWFDTVIGCPIPATVMWTSGKPNRCQMAFAVPSAYWFYLRALKITATKSSHIAEGEGFEFRWAGGQSVLPPSRLDDGREYTWLASPSTTELATIPEDILCYWLDNSNPDVPDLPQRDLNSVTQTDLDDIRLLLETIRSRHATLGYDDWRTVAWGVAHPRGTAVAEVVMQQYFPAKKTGEYRALYRGYNAELSPGIGAIRKMAGPINRDQQQLTLLAQNILRKLEKQ